MRHPHFVLTLVAMTLCAQRTLAEGNESLESVRKSKVQAAEKWVEAVSISVGGDIITQAEQLTAFRALRDARLEAAKTRKDRIDALEAYHEAMKSIYRKTNALFEATAVGGEARRLFEAKYRMLEAQVWLMEEKAKP